MFFLIDFSFTGYVELHNDTRTHRFNRNYFCKLDIPLEIPSEQMFTYNMTKLLIRESTHPGDDQEVQREMILDRERLRDSHKDHGLLKFTTNTCFAETYYVSNQSVLPSRFRLKWFWIFTFLALSIPYKCNLFCNMGYMEYNINRRICTIQQPGTIPISQLGDTDSIENGWRVKGAFARNGDIEFQIVLTTKL